MATTELRRTFDEVAETYDEVRPGYPAAMFDDLASSIPPDGRILEVGSGTGKATLPLAQRGYRITCIELGASLASVARKNLASYPNVEVHTSSFEEWPLEEATFDMALCAQSFHWLDQAIAPEKLARSLHAQGTLALAWNIHAEGADAESFFDRVQEVYRRTAPELISGQSPLVHEEDVRPYQQVLSSSSSFASVEARRYDWTAVYDAPTYVRLLGTYSQHRALPASKREQLFEGIAVLIESSFGGRVVKPYATVLYVARRA